MINQTNFVEIVEKQNQIIKEQAEIIDELFVLLSQHITIKEVDNFSFVEKIKESAIATKSIAGKEGLI